MNAKCLKYTRLLLGVLWSLLFVSCGKDRADEYYELVGANGWIHKTVLANYLYKVSAEQVEFSQSDYIRLKPQEFFQRMLSPLDGKDGVYFSHLDSVNAISRVDDTEISYGFQYQRSEDNIFRILYVEPNSPAEEAGLKRGDWVLKINGENITTSIFDRYVKNPVDACKYTVISKDANGKEIQRVINMPAPRLMVKQDLLVDSLYNIGGKKVAYLVYNGFNLSSLNTTKAVMDRICSEQPDEVIVDLRYNGGGFLNICRMMATYLAPKEVMGKNIFVAEPSGAFYTFEKVVPSLANSSFAYSITVPSMNYKHLFFITSNVTASAAESLIFGLKNNLGTRVQQVGCTTFGKNVAQTYFTNKEYAQLEMWLTTDSICNEQGMSGFSVGLKPDNQFAENPEINGNIDLLPLGSTSDPFLSPIFYYIENGKYPDKQTSGSSRTAGVHISRQIVYSSIDEYQRMAIK